MTSAELLEFLTAVYRDKLTLRNRHVAASRFVGEYNANNTYQYVVNRDDTHVRWLYDAIVDLGGTPEEQAVPELNPQGKAADKQAAVITADRDASAKFVEKWAAKIDALPNARHRTMLRLLIGETKEQLRFFEQALVGRTDLLGKRADGAGTPGTVLSARWVGDDTQRH